MSTLKLIRPPELVNLQRLNGLPLLQAAGHRLRHLHLLDRLRTGIGGLTISSRKQMENPGSLFASLASGPKLVLARSLGALSLILLVAVLLVPLSWAPRANTPLPTLCLSLAVLPKALATSVLLVVVTALDLLLADPFLLRQAVLLHLPLMAQHLAVRP